MGILDFFSSKKRIENAVKEERQRWELEAAKKYIQAGTFGGQAYTKTAHKILEMIGDCDSIHELSEMQRRQLIDVLVTSLPHYLDALNKFSNFVGCPYPVAESDALQRRLDDFAGSECKMLFEYNPARTMAEGTELLSKTWVKNTMRFGMSFVRDWFDPETEQYRGVLLHDSRRFENHSFDGVTEELIYRPAAGGVYRVNTENPYFDEMGYNFYPTSMWGLTLADGSTFFAEQLIKMIVARSNAWVWRGNPIMIDTIGVKPEVAGMWQSDQWDKFNEVVQGIFSDARAAVEAQEKGKRAWISNSIPGDFTRDTKAFGEGITPMTGFVEDADWFIKPIISLTGMPPELVGMFATGDGFSGEKFRMLYRLTKPVIETNRSLLKPRLKARSDVWLSEIGERGSFRARDAYKWEFAEQDFLGPKEKAETAEKIANAFGVVVTAFSTLAEFDLFPVPGDKSPEEIVGELFKEMGLGHVVGVE